MQRLRRATSLQQQSAVASIEVPLASGRHEGLAANSVPRPAVEEDLRRQRAASLREEASIEAIQAAATRSEPAASFFFADQMNIGIELSVIDRRGYAAGGHQALRRYCRPGL